MGVKVSSDQSHGIAIINAIRNMGMTVAAWTKAHRFSPPIVYQAARGKESRNARIHLAMVLKRLPSEIWPNRSDALKQDDDYLYEVLTGIRKLQQ